MAGMGLRTKLFALTYDRMMDRTDRAGLAEVRRQLLSRAQGAVLEIGAGTGGNLQHYGAAVTSLAVTEPDPSMLKRLTTRAASSPRSITVLRAPAEDLPFDDGAFDTVVSSLVLCGVNDQPRAAREIARVLKPGGRLLFIEHVRSDDPKLARFQDRMNWLNRIVVHCDCNRPTLSSIEAEGFTISRLDQMTLPKAPKFVQPLIVGTATI
jgi:ubiquinone/menaquinone biosynthesis C-methylase UbiE